MKILFLSQTVPYPPNSGVLLRGYNVIRQLHRHNKIYLLAFSHPDVLKTEELMKESLRELGRFCELVEYFPLRPKKSTLHKYLTIFESIFSRVPFSVHAYKSFLYRNRIDEIVRAEKIDLIHFDTIALAQFFYNARKLPQAVTHHNIESSVMERRALVEKNWFLKSYLSIQAKKIKRYEISECRKFNCNIVVSDDDAEELKQLSPGINTVTIANGSDTSFFLPNSSKEKPNCIIHVGRLRAANLDSLNYFLSAVWPLIKEKNKDVHLKIVGGEVPGYVNELAQKEDNISVTGFVEDIRPQINEASVVVVPLRFGGGTKLKVLNAMSQGKAIVTTSIGSEGIGVSPGKNIFIADDPIEFAEKTNELLADPTKRASFGEEARKLIESKYSWEIIGEKLQATYEKIKGVNP